MLISRKQVAERAGAGVLRPHQRQLVLHQRVADDDDLSCHDRGPYNTSIAGLAYRGVMRLVPALALALAACSSAPPRATATMPAPANAPDGEPLALDEAPPPPAPSEPVTVEMRDGALALSRPITYQTGSADLAADSDAAIAAVAEFLAAKSYLTTLRIEVHADSQGNTGHNQAMTEARALTTARALVARGVDCTRLLPVGFGETKPIADNSTAEGRAANRRTTLVPAALNGKLIGGMPADGGGVVAGDPCS
jgi:OOP family OmpA-OmpF porin